MRPHRHLEAEAARALCELPHLTRPLPDLPTLLSPFLGEKDGLPNRSIRDTSEDLLPLRGRATSTAAVRTDLRFHAPAMAAEERGDKVRLNRLQEEMGHPEAFGRLPCPHVPGHGGDGE